MTKAEEVGGLPEASSAADAATAPSAAAFLEEAARYFANRPTNGEDSAHWSNVYNAQNCRKIADAYVVLLEALKAANAWLDWYFADEAPMRAGPTRSELQGQLSAAVDKAEGRS